MSPRKLTLNRMAKQGSDGTPLRMLGAAPEQINTWSIAGAVLERGHILRDEALIIWDKIVGEHPDFFDGYPRDEGRTGPFGDDERYKIIAEMSTVWLEGELS